MALTTIDLSSPDLTKSASLIRQACLDSGFFYVINHGVSQELFDDLFHQSRKFFEFPLEEKMKVLRDQNFRGYTPLEDEKLDPSKQTKGDCKEGYYIGVEVAKDDPRATKRFFGSNVWPSEEILPGWRQIMEKYHQEALNVGRKVARLIALALNLNANFFDKPEILEDPIAILRLLHYVDEKSKPELGIYGAGAHSDFGLLTLLVTDEVSGLQICKNKDAQSQNWEDVNPLKGAFIVNIGDMLERWSNNIFRSTMHRVLLSGQERYSVAFFLEPGPDCLVECLPTCHSETNPPRHPPVKYGDYLAQRYKDTHGNATSSY
ncbi:2-oxoglutarate-Fe(II) type oxidoreductase hxnY [Cryptomeria japonica]|uniref:2-oxoglutarate-Fe(II) type oxidoreductase hxnY n=1 Tax=Cryptomeria japonica TaxID=3369 RepID=UPI0025ABF4CF|nr:2-oxoglutarate-Fe(II) type oxidoreductase hxnY [Cryptomeria japonica]